MADSKRGSNVWSRLGSRMLSLTSGATILEQEVIEQLLEKRQQILRMVQMIAALAIPICALLIMTIASLVSSVRVYQDSKFTVVVIEGTIQVSCYSICSNKSNIM